MFYCQYLLGVGHLTRSLALIQNLTEQFHVDLLLGGPQIQRQWPQKQFNLLPLEPLLMREHDSSLYSPSGTPVEQVFSLRSQQIAQVIQEQKYDLFIVELFPFGRGKFKIEILKMLELFRAQNPRGRVLSSVRDILVEQDTQKDKSTGKSDKMLALARAHFDAVLVHSDPQVIRLEDSFPKAQQIQDLLCYTGFVTEPAPQFSGLSRRPEVMVSLGGGSVGDELYHAVYNITEQFPGLRFRFKRSPFMNPGLLAAMDRWASDQVVIEEFSSHFEQDLLGCQLSISMGGYNTVMNVLNTRTPALILAYQANQEQSQRAKILESKSYLRVLQNKDLAPEKLSPLIQNALTRAYPQERLNLSGAISTTKFCRQLIQSKS